jgi:hypothetical protein
MATLLTKKSDTASSVPLAADLTNAAGGAELAVNTADKRLYTKTSGGSVVELGTNPTTLSVSGNVTLGDASTDTLNVGNGGLVKDASGNVGIRTSSPGASLHVNTASNGDDLIRVTGGSSQQLDIGVNSTNGGPYLFSSGSFALRFGTSGSERARIDSSGRLLVNNTTAASDLSSSVQFAVYGSGYTALIKGTSATASVINSWNSATTGNNQFVEFFTEASVTSRGSITYNRGAGLVAYNVTCDYRAKDIIGPMIDSGTLIDSVPVYMGKMKGATQERPMFIAHETPEYAHTGVKDAVDADGNPVYQQMDASALVPVMWAEIQSLRARLAAAGF